MPISYIVCKGAQSAITHNPDFLYEYFPMEPLTVEDFTINAVEVHILILNIITRNETAGQRCRSTLTDITGA